MLSWEELIAQARREQLTLTALVVDSGKSLLELAPNPKRLLVVGNEAHGIPAEWLAACTEQATLPMPGKTESLNAAIAGSIALYYLYFGQKN